MNTLLEKKEKDTAQSQRMNFLAIKTRDGKLYAFAIFDCYDSGVLALATNTSMKTG